MYDVAWSIKRDRTTQVMATTKARVDMQLQAGAQRILQRAMESVRTRTGVTRDSGRAQRVAEMYWTVVFGGAAVYLEFGTAHHPAYPFLIPAALEERAQILRDVARQVGGNIRADYIASAVSTEGGFG